MDLSTKLEQALDPRNPGAWVLVEDTPDYRRYELDMPDGQTILRTEHKNTEALLSQNLEIAKDNAGKRWGDGQIVARIPMNLYYSMGLAEASRQRDTAYIKKILEDPSNRALRTFEGKI